MIPMEIIYLVLYKTIQITLHMKNVKLHKWDL